VSDVAGKQKKVIERTDKENRFLELENEILFALCSFHALFYVIAAQETHVS
jgi:hypothetical protein